MDGVALSADLGGHDGEEDGTRSLTVSDAINAMGFGKFQWACLALMGLFWCVDAMEVLVLSFLGPVLKCEWHITPDDESWLTIVVFIGMCLGALLWGKLSDMYGRKRTMVWSSSLCFLGGLSSSFSPNFTAMLLLRLVTGIGIAGAPGIYAYFLEIVPNGDRGMWCVVVQGWWTIGSVAQALLGWAVLPTLGYRWLLVLTALPVGVMILVITVAPESPRFLEAAGRKDEAQAVINDIARYNRVPPPHLSEAHLPHGSTPDSVSVGAGFRAVFRIILEPQLRRTTILLWFIWLANAFTYYGVVLFTSQVAAVDTPCGANNVPLKREDFVAIIVSASGELPGLIITALFVERVGRRRIQAIQLGIVSLVFILLIALRDVSHGLQTFLLFLARAAIMASFTTVYLYTPEVYHTNVRITATAIAGSFSRVGAVLSPFVGQGLIQRGHKGEAMAIFAVVCGLASFACMCLTVETAGRTLGEGLSVTGLTIPYKRPFERLQD